MEFDEINPCYQAYATRDLGLKDDGDGDDDDRLDCCQAVGGSEGLTEVSVDQERRFRLSLVRGCLHVCYIVTTGFEAISRGAEGGFEGER